MIKSYRELNVWQKAMDFAVHVYKVLKGFPAEERYGLCDQLRRAVVSIPSNIAEGQERNSRREFVQFLKIANGSKSELETQLLICVQVGYLTESEIQPLMRLLAEIGRMIASLLRTLSTPN